MLLEQEKTKPIIQSLLWTDLYKITMSQMAFHQYPEVGAIYEFINRGKTFFPLGFGEKLQDQVNTMADLKLESGERQFLKDQCPFLTDDFIDWFSNYRFNPNEVNIEQKGHDLKIDFRGPWQRTIYWEVPLMALISELYFTQTHQPSTFNYIERAKEKGRMMKEAGALLLEFGTRRAHSNLVHKDVLQALIETAKPVAEGGVLLGTSNVKLAMEFGIPASGTFAHEDVMAHAAMFGYKMANEKTMDSWAKEYLGLGGGSTFPRLGTALTDTFTTDVFLRSFNEKWAKYYTYLRQDSGNPFVEGEKLVTAWKNIFVDPKAEAKGIVFSDGLDIPTALKLQEQFSSRVAAVFGIGTDLTNDVGVKPLNIVIKAHSFILPDKGEIPVCKLSDDREKQSGDPGAIAKAREELDLV